MTSRNYGDASVAVTGGCDQRGFTQGIHLLRIGECYATPAILHRRRRRSGARWRWSSQPDVSCPARRLLHGHSIAGSEGSTCSDVRPSETWNGRNLWKQIADLHQIWSGLGHPQLRSIDVRLGSLHYWQWGQPWTALVISNVMPGLCTVCRALCFVRTIPWWDACKCRRTFNHLPWGMTMWELTTPCHLQKIILLAVSNTGVGLGWLWCWTLEIRFLPAAITRHTGGH